MICRSLGFDAWSAHSTQVRQNRIRLSFSTMVVAPNSARHAPNRKYPARLLSSQFNGCYRKLRRLSADKRQAPAQTRANRVAMKRADFSVARAAGPSLGSNLGTPWPILIILLTTKLSLDALELACLEFLVAGL